jgi:hypothetical protein
MTISLACFSVFILEYTGEEWLAKKTYPRRPLSSLCMTTRVPKYLELLFEDRNIRMPCNKARADIQLCNEAHEKPRNGALVQALRDTARVFQQ